MAIGISTCCVRNIQRARLAPRTLSFGYSQPDFNQYGSLPRLRREMHETPILRTFSAPRKPHDSSTLASMPAGKKDALTQGYTRSTQVRHISAKAAHVLKSLSSVEPENQQASVAQETGHNVMAKDEIPTIKSMDSVILKWFMDERHLYLHSSVLEKTPNYFSIRSECSIGETGERIHIEGRGVSPPAAKTHVDRLLISELKKSGAWNKLRLIDARSQSVLHNGNEPHFLQFHTFWAKGFFNLDWVLSRTADGDRTFSLFCHILGSAEHVEAEVHDREERNLDIKASLLLISKLQKRPVWNRWIKACSPESALLDTLSIPLEIDGGDKSKLPFSNRRVGRFPGVTMEPRTALNEAALQHRCKLDIGTKWSSTSGSTCTLTFVKGRLEVHATTQGTTLKSATDRAYFLLIHILHITRGWEGLVPHVNLALDDDLIRTMVHTRAALLKAGSLVQQVCDIHPRDDRGRKGFIRGPKKDKETRSAELLQSLATINESQDPLAVAFRSKRARMQVTEQKQRVLDLISQNTYSIIVAETGSGKSSQVPQIILNDAIEKNEGVDCRVLCVQPRRMAAQMLAKRVAEERLETVGNTVGCIVRGSHEVLEQGGSITYCTTGIFLKMLENPRQLFQDYTHIMLDEVHERDLDIDSAMLILKHYVDQMQDTIANGVNIKSSSIDASGSGDLPKVPPKVIVSSATVDVNMFASYFRNKQSDGTVSPAPHISIPGRQFPVTKHFLDEILEDLMETFELKALASFLREKETARFLDEHYAQFDEIEPSQAETQTDVDSETIETFSPDSTALIDIGADPLIPLGLVVAQILKILKTTQNGSIIVFLPGIASMTAVKDMLELLAQKVGVAISDENLFRVLILHSQRPEEMEKLSFETPPGCRRILLSTDIAEASVTIPDLKYVIDIGRVNQASYESDSLSLSIMPHWISLSSASQRAGRAGRVQEGDYFFLGTKRRYDTLRITKAPEILRANLDTVCLRSREVAPQIPLMDYFRMAIESPSEEKVQSTITGLQRLRALDGEEHITKVGSMLVNLPVEPNFGKMILLGVVFRCLEPMVVLSLLGDAEIFFRGVTPQEIKYIFQKRVMFSQGLNSDHIASFNAYKAIQNVMMKEGYRNAHDFATSNCLYFPVFRNAYYNVQHLINALIKQKIVPPSTPIFDDDGYIGGVELNTNSRDIPLVKALMTYCVSPRIVAPTFAPKLQRGPFMTTSTETNVLPAPRSLNKFLSTSGNLAIYQQKLQLLTGTTMLPDTTVISPLVACLFSNETWSKPERLLVDSWLNIGLDLEHTSESAKNAGFTVKRLSDVIDQSIQRAIFALGLSSMRVPSRDFKIGQRDHFTETREMFNQLLQTSVKELLMRDLHRATPRDAVKPTRSSEVSSWTEVHA